MGITCQEVWRDISDYVDDNLDPLRRIRLTRHFAECRRCTTVLEGTRNVIRLYRDERIFAPPEGFHDRLRARPNKRREQAPDHSTRPSRRAVLAWTLSAAAALPLGFALLSSRRLHLLRLAPSRPAGSPDSPSAVGLIAVSQDASDKIFHIPGCPYLHGKPKFITVEEAVREGYSPCAVCILKRKPEKKG
jgi:hypothetical protein